MNQQSSRKQFARNRFRHVPDAMFNEYLAFAEANPGIVSTAQVLEKLMIYDFVVPLLEGEQGQRILEIGSGSGLHSAMLTNVGEVSATELRSTVFWLGDSVDETRSTVFNALAKRPVEFRYNDGRSIPFEDASFDLVFHNSVIEHVPDVVAFNREVRRLLKPGGLCVCITGTPALCRFRYFKHYLLKWPLIAAYGGATVLLHRAPARRLYEKARRRVRAWHFERTTDRLRAIAERHYPGDDTASAIAASEIRRMYPSLRHFVREPEYNEILMESLAERHRVTPRALILQLAKHFSRPINDLRFRMTPSTHSQHTENYRTEISEWRLDNWNRSFEEAGFRVETVRGYRYQQAVDLTPSDRLNARIMYRALPLAWKAADRLPAKHASEIIILARAI